MPEATRTIKVRLSTYRALKLLAADRGEKLMDLVAYLVENERRSGLVVTSVVTLDSKEPPKGEARSENTA